MTTPKIQVSVPYVARQAQEKVNEVMERNWLSPNGPVAEMFAAALGEFMKGQAVLTNSGTSALEIAIRAVSRVYGVSKGAIVVPSFTCPDCAVAVIKAGFIPAFCDVDRDRHVIRAVDLEELYSRWPDDSDVEIVGVMPIHLWGMTPELDVYHEARRRGLFIVDDIAEALGARPRGHDLLDLTDVACTSFRGEKPLPIGTGGAIFTRHEGVYGVAKSMIGLNSPGGFNRLVSFDMAYSYEYPELLAAFGLGQLDGFKTSVVGRWEILDWYKAEGIWIPFDSSAGDIPWKLPVNTSNALRAWKMAREAGIETTPPHLPLHQMSYLAREYGRYNPVRLRNAEWLRDRVLMFPLHPLLTRGDVARIAEVIQSPINGSDENDIPF